MGGQDAVPVRVAAERLAVTGQTVRNMIRRGDLRGRKEGRRWLVDGDDVERLAQEQPGSRREPPAAPPTVGELAEAVAELLRREAAASKLVTALERERDRFRADAAAAREAALRVNAVARETDQAVRHLLEVLELQSDALTQLLAPGSPEDLAR